MIRIALAMVLIPTASFGLTYTMVTMGSGHAETAPKKERPDCPHPHVVMYDGTCSDWTTVTIGGGSTQIGFKPTGV